MQIEGWGLTNTDWGPELVNTNLGTGPLYTNWDLGCQKTNWGRGPGPGAGKYKYPIFQLSVSYYFNGALNDQLFKKQKLVTELLHVQFFVRAKCFAYVPARAHVPFFFTMQNKDAQKGGHTSEVLNVWAYKQRHCANDLCSHKFKTILVQDIFDIFLCCRSIDFIKAVKFFSTSFFWSPHGSFETLNIKVRWTNLISIFTNDYCFMTTQGDLNIELPWTNGV